MSASDNFDTCDPAPASRTNFSQVQSSPASSWQVRSIRLLTAICLAAAVTASTIIAPSGARTLGDTSDTLEALVESRDVAVNIDNFVRAATNIELGKYVSLAGGVNRFYHFREPVLVDKQPTIRMNRDTLYSTVVVDISKGATLSLPDVGERYMSAMVINQDHYINKVFHGGGAYTLDVATFDTPYVIVFIRTLVNAADPKDVAAVNAIQDKMTVEAASANAFIVPDYDKQSYEGLVQAILGLGAYASDSSRVFGARDKVDPVRHFLGTAIGWGGLPETEAFYLNVDPGLPVGEYKIEVPADVPVEAFWSISAYNAKGFFEKNSLGAYNINSVTGKQNDDGSMTVHLGGCKNERVNCLPIVEGWNYTVRLYQPRTEVLDGSWTFPEARPVR